MVQTDGTGRHDSVNLGLRSVKMPDLGVHFVLKGQHVASHVFLPDWKKPIFLTLNLLKKLHRCRLGFFP